MLKSFILFLLNLIIRKKKKFYFGQFTNIAYEHTKEFEQQFYSDYLLFANVGLLNGTHCKLAREEDATAKIIISE